MPRSYVVVSTATGTDCRCLHRHPDNGLQLRLSPAKLPDNRVCFPEVRMSLALRFISGKYQGGEFPLEDEREVIVGRSSDLDMVLVEEMVSRRHARIRLSEGTVNIDDLGSTNGTFVNGERISNAKLNEGDRVLIGSNILKVVSASEPSESSPAQVTLGVEPPPMERPASRTGSDALMTGSLEEIPLPDLLQLFGSSRKTGTLKVTCEGKVGRIHLRKGLLHNIEAETQEGQPLPLAGKKFIYRMLSWETGQFELMPEESREFEDALDASVQEILMEGFRQKDELEQLQERLPKSDAPLQLQFPLEAKLVDLESDQLEVFQAVMNSTTLGGMLDLSPFEDLKSSQLLLILVEKQYVQTA